MPTIISTLLKRASTVGARLSAARLGHATNIINSPRFKHHPTVISHEKQNQGGNFSLPTGLNLERLYTGTALLAKKQPLGFHMFQVELKRLHSTAIVPGEHIPTDVLENSALVAPMITHRSRESSHIHGILAQGAFEDKGLSVGMSTQPGICLSSEIWGSGLVAHLMHHDKAPRIWGTVPSDSVYLGHSLYQFADKTTYKGRGSVLPIQPHAYFTPEEGLVITDAKRFVQHNLAALSFRIVSNLRDLDNLAAYLLQVNPILDEGVPKIRDSAGQLYDCHQLAQLLPEQFVQVVGENCLDFAQKCDKISNSNFARRTIHFVNEYAQALKSVVEATGHLLVRADIQEEIANAGLDQLATQLNIVPTDVAQCKLHA